MDLIVVIIVILAAGGFVLFAMTKPRTPKGLCPRGGPRWKNLLAYLLIKGGKKRTGTDAVIDPEEFNRRVPPPQGISTDQYNDSFVFQGGNDRGTLIMTRIGFRNGGRLAEVWLWISRKGTKYHNTNQCIELSDPDAGSLSEGGLSFTCTDTKQGTWKIEWQGPLAPGNIDCSLSLTFTPDSSIYHSDKHMSADSYAKAMGEMNWSKEYFENLKSENQTRIEQGGRLEGTVSMGDQSEEVTLRGVRDHSWGKRNWNFIKRYIWNVLSFSDGIELKGHLYRYLVYTTVNYGTSFRCLVSGWLGGDDSVIPIISATDQALIGEDGVIPEEIRCRFTPKGCGPLDLTIYRNGLEHSWFMQKKTFEVCEAYCTFEVTDPAYPDRVNGGFGMSEFGYSKEAGYTSRF